MKHLLFGTTALVAASIVAGGANAQAKPTEKIKLGVGGYFQAYFIAGDEDDGAADGVIPAQPGFARRGYTIKREAEIIFTGKTTLDNGIDVGVQVQLEAESCTDIIDESYIFVEGSFGRIEAGAINSAPYRMHYQAPNPSGSSAFGLTSPNIRLVQGGTNQAFALGIAAPTTYQGLTSDAEKITYYTPRLAGFQLGISYSPDACEDGNAGASTGNNCGGSYSGFQGDAEVGQQAQAIEIGFNYVSKLNGVDIAISAGYGQSKLENDIVAVATATAGGVSTAAGTQSALGNIGPNPTTATLAAGSLDDREEYSIGAQFGYMGFTIGAAYRYDNLATDAGHPVDDHKIWSAGIRYVWGPWGVGFQYSHAETSFRSGAILNNAGATAFTNSGGEDEVDAFEIAGTYQLGPGILLATGIQFWSLDASGSDLSRVTGTATDKRAAENDATIFYIGTSISF